MSDINNLTSLDALSEGDLFPIWSGNNYDTRRVSLSALVAFIMAQIGGSFGLITQYAAPGAAGFSVTVTPLVDGSSMWLMLTPAAAYAAGTVVLPLADVCQDGQEVLATSTQAITALTIGANGATAVRGAPATLAANGFFRLRFDAIGKTWTRVG